MKEFCYVGGGLATTAEEEPIDSDQDVMSQFDSLIALAQELSYRPRSRECGGRNGRPIGDRPAEQGYLGFVN